MLGKWGLHRGEYGICADTQTACREGDGTAILYCLCRMHDSCESSFPLSTPFLFFSPLPSSFPPLALIPSHVVVVAAAVPCLTLS